MTEPREQPDTDYVPIACALHSEYELAILRRRPVHLVWAEDNFAGSEIGRPQGARHHVIHDEVVLPLDIKTTHREEYLVCRAANGTMREIRLDRVRRMGPA